MIINSYKGAGELEFGMTPDKVHSLIGKPQKTIKKTHGSDPSDYFFTPGISCHYGAKGLEAIEFFSPEPAMFDGTNLLEKTEASAEKWLETKDPEAQIDPPSLISEKLGISFYVEDGHVETVLVFRRGYYGE